MHPCIKKILIVEDDEALSRGISFILEKSGYNVFLANNILKAEQCLREKSPELIILDVNLPDGDGISFCRKLRESVSLPVIMLTARDLETDEVSGLMAGADDYITKPFSLSVLVARVESIARRLGQSKTQHIVFSGKFRLNMQLCKLFCGDEEIPLSATELRLVHLFMSNSGQILSKKQILSLWDMQGNFVDENTLSVNINRLRAKIENTPKTPQIIKTIHGLGYIWVET